jgi:hypothetical protein
MKSIPITSRVKQKHSQAKGQSPNKAIGAIVAKLAPMVIGAMGKNKKSSGGAKTNKTIVNVSQASGGGGSSSGYSQSDNAI